MKFHADELSLPESTPQDKAAKVQLVQSRDVLMAASTLIVAINARVLKLK